jgi:hypothetical protein
MPELSLLRLSALLIGVAIVAFAAHRLRRYRGERAATLLAAMAGLVLMALGAVPALANLPAQIFSLRDQQGGRLITLLILAVAVLWFAIVWNRAKIAHLGAQQDRLLRALALERVAWPQGRAGPCKPGAGWIVIPALDEADNLRRLLPRIPDTIQQRPTQVLLVDDGSSDDTVEVARGLGAVAMTVPVNGGGGLALRAGFDLAGASGAAWVVTMDADGQHDPEQLARLVEPLENGQADLVVGSRKLGTHEAASAARAFGVGFFNFVISRLIGTRVTDCASGYRAIAAPTLRRLHLTQAQYHTAELIIDAGKRGLRLSEVPITISRRVEGVSKKGRELAYATMFLRTIVKTWLR